MALPFALLLGLSLLAASCGGEELLTERATAFEGGALSNFGGADGADTDARDIARAVAGDRGYDFIDDLHLVSAGAATSWTLAALSDYGDGAGTLALAADDATLTLSVDSDDPDVTNVGMTGEFSAAEAQAAVNNPGSSFVIEWSIEWDASGVPQSLSAQQTLVGTDWVEI